MSDLRRCAPARRQNPCRCCGGCGFLRFYDADVRETHEECWACEGEAATGAFVLHLEVAGRSVERTWHTFSFGVAVMRAGRFAGILGHILTLWAVRAEVHVVFLPHDRSVDREVVAAVPVPTGSRLLAPAGGRR